MKPSFIRSILVCGIIIAAIIVVMYFFKKNRENVTLETLLESGASDRVVNEYLSELENAYKNDHYGGETPHETVELLIRSLRTGDIKTASYYFLPDNKEDVFEELAMAKEYKELDRLIAVLERRDAGTLLFEGAFQFNVFTAEGRQEFSIDLIKNPYTNKWKIERL